MPGSMFRRFLVPALLALVAPAFCAAQAFAAGETLTLAQDDPAAVAGQVTHFTASGDLNENDTISEFHVDVFLKNPQDDATCGADLDTESATAAASGGRETSVSPPGGFSVGTGPNFDQPFEITFAGAGEYLLCGYVQGDFSTFATDDLNGSVSAAPAHETTTPPPGSTPTPENKPPAVGPPAVLRAPWITDRRHLLTCHPGSWSNQPTSLTYGWYFKKGRRKLGSGRTLRVRRALEGHQVVCRVTAANAAGSAAVSSGPLRAH
jgi:hypothetical protein